VRSRSFKAEIAPLLTGDLFQNIHIDIDIIQVDRVMDVEQLQNAAPLLNGLVVLRSHLGHQGVNIRLVSPLRAKSGSDASSGSGKSSGGLLGNLTPLQIQDLAHIHKNLPIDGLSSKQAPDWLTGFEVDLCRQIFLGPPFQGKSPLSPLDTSG
jgi:hypothetical protein